jgi:hypothetical protein
MSYSLRSGGKGATEHHNDGVLSEPRDRYIGAVTRIDQENAVSQGLQALSDLTRRVARLEENEGAKPTPCFTDVIATIPEVNDSGRMKMGDEPRKLEWMVSVKGKCVRALVDTGSPLSFINHRLALDLQVVVTRETVSSCKGINGHWLQTDGKASFIMKSKHSHYPVEALLLQGPLEVVLGMDFITRHVKMINIREQALTTLDEVVMLERVRHTRIECRREDLEKIEGMQTLREQASATLTVEHRMAFEEFLCKYSEVFSKEKSDIGLCEMDAHQINLSQQKVVKKAPYRVSPEKQVLMHQEVETMLSAGIIERSKSPWCAPVVLAKKKDGSTRFCIDFRGLNAITVPDAQPMPNIQGLLQLTEASWFCTLDLRSGFWQVPMRAADKEKTAFAVPGKGLFHFTRMPFGLINASATFQRLMERVLEGLPSNSFKVYIDDVLICGNTFEELMEHLHLVFVRLREANLKVAAKKCRFFQRRVEYLGHVVSGEGIAAREDKLSTIQNWPRPTNQSELRSFLGLCSYYRKFVKGFADISAPLHAVAAGKGKLLWLKEAERAFCQLKERLTLPPVMTYFKPDATLILDCDASNVACGAVLQQEEEGGLKVLGYYSACFSKEERNYCVTRRELLAIVKGCRHFREFLVGKCVKVRTDHSSLAWLQSCKDPDGQFARWTEELAQYKLDVTYRDGRKHQNADAMSRRPCGGTCSKCLNAEKNLNQPEAMVALVSLQVPTNGEESWDTRIRQSLEKDVGLRELRVTVSEGVKPRTESWVGCAAEVQALYAQWELLRVENGIVYRTANWHGVDVKQMYVPPAVRWDILKSLHDNPEAGHLGQARTLERARERYFWPGMKKEIRWWIASCHACRARQGPPNAPRAPMQTMPTGFPMQRVAFDILGPLTTTTKGNRYILVLKDYFTKWVEAYPIAEQSATTVAKIIVNEFVARHGVPLEMHSDQGPNFESHVCHAMWELLGVKKTRTTPLHPQSDGMVERWNRTILDILSKYVKTDQSNWDECLPMALLAYRSSIHASTNVTPARALYGREIRLPRDLEYGCATEKVQEYPGYIQELSECLERTHEFARRRLELCGAAQKTFYDRKAAADKIEVGEKVWLHAPTIKRGYSPKLGSPWCGPWVIKSRPTDVIYTIIRNNSQQIRTVHRNRICRYLIREDQQTATWKGRGPRKAPQPGPSMEDAQREERYPIRARRQVDRYGWDQRPVMNEEDQEEQDEQEEEDDRASSHDSMYSRPSI